MEVDKTKCEPAWIGFYRRAQSYGLFTSEPISFETDSPAEQRRKASGVIMPATTPCEKIERP
jgi:hypothetical protein